MPLLQRANSEQSFSHTPQYSQRERESLGRRQRWPETECVKEGEEEEERERQRLDIEPLSCIVDKEISQDEISVNNNNTPQINNR